MFERYQNGGRFSGKVAVVTGGASGIGNAVVRALLAEGARVASLDLNGGVLNELERQFGELFSGVKGDVTDEVTVSQFISQCVWRFGGIDLALNVAGASRSGTIVEQSLKDWDFTLDLCLKGVLSCLKYEAQHMSTRGGGVIVNVASVCAHMAVYGGAAYCAAKSGVEMVSRVAAIELAEKHIRVNTLLPGYTYTPGMRLASEAPEQDAAILDRIPLKRAASPREIAAPALFLASEDASYITGASLVVDGGWEMTGYPPPRGRA